MPRSIAFIAAVVPGAFDACCAIRRHSSLLGATCARKLDHTFLGKDGAAWDSFYFDNFFSAFSATRTKTVVMHRRFAQQFSPSTAYKNVLEYWERSATQAGGDAPAPALHRHQDLPRWNC